MPVIEFRRTLPRDPGQGTSHPHPDREVVTRFGKGAASNEEARVVIRHLLKRCAYCSRLVIDARTVWR